MYANVQSERGNVRVSDDFGVKEQDGTITNDNLQVIADRTQAGVFDYAGSVVVTFAHSFTRIDVAGHRYAFDTKTGELIL